jgi:hypothetical protein
MNLNGVRQLDYDPELLASFDKAHPPEKVVRQESVPDSRSLIGSGIGNSIIQAWNRLEPGPRRWLVDAWIPEHALSILFGDGGKGKSYIALYLAICVCLKRDFLGRTVERGKVLFLDAELDEDEFMRRAFALSRGLGLTKPPEGLYYWRLPGSLAQKEVHRAALAAVKECGAILTVLDSLTVGSQGIDPKEARDVISLLKSFEGFGTVLAIDHIRAPEAGENLSAYRPFGSTFKHHLSRSLIQVTQAAGGGLVLRQTKANFTDKSVPLLFGLEFDGSTVRLREVAANDPRLAGVEDQLSAVEQVAHALAAFPGAVATPEGLAGNLGMKEKTVRNHLSALHGRKRARPLGDGRWQILEQTKDGRAK